MSRGLDALKFLKENLCSGCRQECCSCPYSSEVLQIEKELKALEIIKEHTLYCENVDCFVFADITKEVNELLKEVLL